MRCLHIKNKHHLPCSYTCDHASLKGWMVWVCFPTAGEVKMWNSLSFCAHVMATMTFNKRTYIYATVCCVASTKDLCCVCWEADELQIFTLSAWLLVSASLPNLLRKELAYCQRHTESHYFTTDNPMATQSLFVDYVQPHAYSTLMCIINNINIWHLVVNHLSGNVDTATQSIFTGKKEEHSQGRGISSPCRKWFQSTLEKKEWQRSPWKPSLCLDPQSKLCSRSTNCLLARGSSGNLRECWGQTIRTTIQNTMQIWLQFNQTAVRWERLIDSKLFQVRKWRCQHRLRWEYLKVDDVLDCLGRRVPRKRRPGVDHLISYDPEGPPVTLDTIGAVRTAIHGCQDLRGDEVLVPNIHCGSFNL